MLAHNVSSQSLSAGLVSRDLGSLASSALTSCVALGHLQNHFEPPVLALKYDIGELVLRSLMIA